eukprot:1156462-Pelagomonas_calceolata.AAC.6
MIGTAAHYCLGGGTLCTGLKGLEKQSGTVWEKPTKKVPPAAARSHAMGACVDPAYGFLILWRAAPRPFISSAEAYARAAITVHEATPQVPQPRETCAQSPYHEEKQDLNTINQTMCVPYLEHWGQACAPGDHADVLLDVRGIRVASGIWGSGGRVGPDDCLGIHIIRLFLDQPPASIVAECLFRAHLGIPHTFGIPCTLAIPAFARKARSVALHQLLGQQGKAPLNSNRPCHQAACHVQARDLVVWKLKPGRMNRENAYVSGTSCASKASHCWASSLLGTSRITEEAMLVEETGHHMKSSRFFHSPEVHSVLRQVFLLCVMAKH